MFSISIVSPVCALLSFEFWHIRQRLYFLFAQAVRSCHGAGHTVWLLDLLLPFCRRARFLLNFICCIYVCALRKTNDQDRVCSSWKRCVDRVYHLQNPFLKRGQCRSRSTNIIQKKDAVLWKITH